MAAIEDLRVKTLELLDEGLRSGVLAPEEHRWRQGHVANAHSVDELEALVEDLLAPVPETTGTALVSARASQMTLMASRTFFVSDLGRRSEVVTIMGSSRIDLNGLDPAEPVTLELVTIMGDAEIVVPPGVRVRVECTPVMGDCHVAPQLQSADALVRITGAVVMGSLRVVPSKKG